MLGLPRTFVGSDLVCLVDEVNSWLSTASPEIKHLSFDQVPTSSQATLGGTSGVLQQKFAMTIWYSGDSQSLPVKAKLFSYHSIPSEEWTYDESIQATKLNNLLKAYLDEEDAKVLYAATFFENSKYLCILVLTTKRQG